MAHGNPMRKRNSPGVRDWILRVDASIEMTRTGLSLARVMLPAI